MTTDTLLDVAFCSACIGLAWALAWTPGSWEVQIYFFACAIASSMLKSSYEEYKKKVAIAN